MSYDTENLLKTDVHAPSVLPGRTRCLAPARYLKIGDRTNRVTCTECLQALRRCAKSAVVATAEEGRKWLLGSVAQKRRGGRKAKIVDGEIKRPHRRTLEVVEIVAARQQAAIEENEAVLSDAPKDGTLILEAI